MSFNAIRENNIFAKVTEFTVFFPFRLELKWSVIEFERSSLVVCENIGILPLTLKRTGDSEGLAFVSIDARDRTTQKDEDYIPSSAQQVQFDPGSVDFFKDYCYISKHKAPPIICCRRQFQIFCFFKNNK